jgi:hypothetical protein
MNLQGKITEEEGGSRNMSFAAFHKVKQETPPYCVFSSCNGSMKQKLIDYSMKQKLIGYSFGPVLFQIRF